VSFYLLQSNAAHREWLEDLTLRLVSVLALDRFGDYVSDGVVAPVRESVAQCVGAAATLMTSEGQELTNLVKVLALLLKQKQWEVRHGSLLALKYLLAVTQVKVSYPEEVSLKLNAGKVIKLICNVVGFS